MLNALVVAYKGSIWQGKASQQTKGPCSIEHRMLQVSIAGAAVEFAVDAANSDAVIVKRCHFILQQCHRACRCTRPGAYMENVQMRCPMAPEDCRAVISLAVCYGCSQGNAEAACSIPSYPILVCIKHVDEPDHCWICLLRSQRE